MVAHTGELIIIRSLADSDLGLFAAHRAGARSKQRAININSRIAKRLLSPRLFAAGGARIETKVVMGQTEVNGRRHFGLVGKNWRLGGNKIAGDAFSALDSKDFMLIRSIEGNDGDQPIMVRFVSRATDQIAHAGIGAVLGPRLHQSMAAIASDDDGFDALVAYCPAVRVIDVDRGEHDGEPTSDAPFNRATPIKVVKEKSIPPMPREPVIGSSRKLKPHEKLRSPHLLERMMQVAGDLSAPAHDLPLIFSSTRS